MLHFRILKNYWLILADKTFKKKKIAVGQFKSVDNGRY